jgi:hypothetical protein
VRPNVKLRDTTRLDQAEEVSEVERGELLAQCLHVPAQLVPRHRTSLLLYSRRAVRTHLHQPGRIHNIRCARIPAGARRADGLDGLRGLRGGHRLLRGRAALDLPVDVVRQPEDAVARPRLDEARPVILRCRPLALHGTLYINEYKRGWAEEQ